jgi:hypothetical protein
MHVRPLCAQMRVVDCYSEPHAFVEVSETAPWKLLRINLPAQKVTGANSHAPGQECVACIPLSTPCLRSWLGPGLLCREPCMRQERGMMTVAARRLGGQPG